MSPKSGGRAQRQQRRNLWISVIAVVVISVGSFAAVFAAFDDRLMRNRPRPHMRSERIGLRLYGIADEPTCPGSAGSSISCRCANSRKSVPSL